MILKILKTAMFLLLTVTNLNRFITNSPMDVFEQALAVAWCLMFLFSLIDLFYPRISIIGNQLEIKTFLFMKKTFELNKITFTKGQIFFTKYLDLKDDNSWLRLKEMNLNTSQKELLKNIHNF